MGCRASKNAAHASGMFGNGEIIVSNTLATLMERNLSEVFGEWNSERRKLAISELYTEDCTFFESGEQIVGRDALNARSSAFSGKLQDSYFVLVGPAEVNNDHGRLRWHFGTNGTAPVVAGMDVAVFERGRIRALYVFIDR